MTVIAATSAYDPARHTRPAATPALSFDPAAPDGVARLRGGVAALVAATQPDAAVREATVGRIMAALADWQGAEGPVQLRLARLSQAVGATTVQGFAIEAALVRDGQVAAADTRVFDLAGGKVAVATDSVARGFRAAAYELAASPAAPAGDGRVARAEAALADVRRTMDALKALRLGDGDPLKALIAELAAARAGG
ncbi:MAG: hypothetical protein OHK0024_30670 [Thalassobaculales bacterium]